MSQKVNRSHPLNDADAARASVEIVPATRDCLSIEPARRIARAYERDLHFRFQFRVEKGYHATLFELHRASSTAIGVAS